MKISELLETIQAASSHEVTVEGNVLKTEGHLFLRSLTSLSEGVSLSAGGNLFLRSLTSLSEGVSLSAGGHLDLRSLTSLSEGVSLSAGGNLDLGRLTSLSEGMSLSAGGNLDLGSLTSLSEGMSLSAGGNLYLGRLTSPHQVYKGKAIELYNVDGFTMQKLSSNRMVGECEVYLAAHFNGRGDGKKCYIAQKDGLFAHGDSILSAVRDVQFKAMQENLDVEQLVLEIKSSGVITFNQYRLLTGACERGLREGIKSLRLPEDTQELPIDKVVKLSAGRYGGERVAELFG